MARPPATTIITCQVSEELAIDILTADGLWTVLYKDEPINIRQRYWDLSGEKNKYLRTSYSNLSPAQNLADKLNKEFDTDEFIVRKTI